MKVVFNPIEWLLGFLVTALGNTLVSIMQIVEWAVLYRPPIDEFPFYNQLGGSAVGAAGPIVYIVMFIIISTAIFLPAARGRVIPAMFYAVAVSIATPYWYRMIGGIQTWSIELTNGVLTIYGDSISGQVNPDQPGESITSKILEFNPGIFGQMDLFLGSTTLMAATFWGVHLVSIVWSYVILTQVVAFGGLIAAALLGFGGRVEKVFQMFVSLGLVSVLFGVPVVVLILETGIAFTGSEFWNNVSGGSAYATGFIVVLTLVLAVASQILLVLVFYKATQKVMGKLKSFIEGGNISARLLGRSFDSGVNQNGSVARSMSEPERGLNRESPGLIRQGTALAKQQVKQRTRDYVKGKFASTETSATSTSEAADVASRTTTDFVGSSASEAADVVTSAGVTSAEGVAGTTGGSTVAGSEAIASRVAAAAAPRAAVGGAASVGTPAAMAGSAGAVGAAGATSAASAGAASAGAGAATAGTAAAAGIPTAGVGAAVVVGAVVAKKAVDVVHENREVKQNIKDARESKEEGS